MMLGTEMRLATLEAKIRLRRFGLWPWIALFGWALFAAGQEPRLLRSFGIYLGAQGTWSGAAILLAALAGSGDAGHKSGNTGRHGSILRTKVIVSCVVALGLCLVVGVTQAAFAWAADMITARDADLTAATRSAAGFAFATLPASIAFAGLVPEWRGSIAAKVAVVGAVGFSLSLSTVCFSAPSVTAVAASLLAATGVACMSALIASPATVFRTQPSHAHRHSR